MGLHPIRELLDKRGGGIDKGLQWLSDELRIKTGCKVEARTLRAYSSGERRPRASVAVALASLLKSDAVTLMTWTADADPAARAKPKRRRGRVRRAA